MQQRRVSGIYYRQPSVAFPKCFGLFRFTNPDHSRKSWNRCKNATIPDTPGIFYTGWNIIPTKAGIAMLHNLKNICHRVLPDSRKRKWREQEVEPYTELCMWFPYISNEDCIFFIVWLFFLIVFHFVCWLKETVTERNKSEQKWQEIRQFHWDIHRH